MTNKEAAIELRQLAQVVVNTTESLRIPEFDCIASRSELADDLDKVLDRMLRIAKALEGVA